MDYRSCGQSDFALADQFFIIITRLSKLLTPYLQHRRLVNILVMLKKNSISISDPKNFDNLSNHKRKIWKSCFMGLPPSQG
jgi:hypothetical protein